MKIRLTILDTDSDFLSRLTLTCANRYPDKLEVRTFTDEQLALESLKNGAVDIFLASDVFDIQPSVIPARCSLAYLVESDAIDSIKEQKAISKYKKIETFYKNVLEIYSENIPSSVSLKLSDEGKGAIIQFSSASGGVGCSTMAASCARHFASKGASVIYFSLEQFMSTDIFFSGEGNATFSDVVFALKSKRGNLPLKVEGCVKNDASGVHFISSSKTPLDLRELDNDDISELLDAIMLASNYEYIVVDVGSLLTDISFEVLKHANKLVLVSDGSAVSNLKTSQALATLEILERDADVSYLSRTALVYNKFSSKTGCVLDFAHVYTMGGAQRYEQATAQDIVQQLQGLNIFDTL
ncbi:MAG: hypothetical protein LBG97_05420 [Coriobacteriales bacterium]|jgi:MinD-like ATPase involved in chromosome partitioning or flagellar assembly|nr:hypothetical protein [Coriobacteriales bacterium]